MRAGPERYSFLLLCGRVARAATPVISSPLSLSPVSCKTQTVFDELDSYTTQFGSLAVLSSRAGRFRRNRPATEEQRLATELSSRPTRDKARCTGPRSLSALALASVSACRISSRFLLRRASERCAASRSCSVISAQPATRPSLPSFPTTTGPSASSLVEAPPTSILVVGWARSSGSRRTMTGRLLLLVIGSAFRAPRGAHEVCTAPRSATVIREVNKGQTRQPTRLL